MTHDKAWVLWLKTLHFSENNILDPATGPWTKRFLILAVETPPRMRGKGAKPLWSNVNAVPDSIRQPYRKRYRALLRMDENQLEKEFHRRPIEEYRTLQARVWEGDTIRPEFMYFYLGLEEFDDLWLRVFVESALANPASYAQHTLSEMWKSVTKRRPGFILSRIKVVDRRHIGQEGRARYDLGHLAKRFPYIDPTIWVMGHQFFRFANDVSIQPWMQWLTILIGLLLCSYRLLRDRQMTSHGIYLFVGVGFLIALIGLVSSIHEIRSKELWTIDRLLCALCGVTASLVWNGLRLRPARRQSNDKTRG